MTKITIVNEYRGSGGSGNTGGRGSGNHGQNQDGSDGYNNGRGVQWGTGSQWKREADPEAAPQPDMTLPAGQAESAYAAAVDRMSNEVKASQASAQPTVAQGQAKGNIVSENGASSNGRGSFRPNGASGNHK